MGTLRYEQVNKWWNFYGASRSTSVRLRRAAFQKQPDETGIVKNMKSDWRAQVIVTITEKAEYHAWRKYRNGHSY